MKATAIEQLPTIQTKQSSRWQGKTHSHSIAENGMWREREKKYANMRRRKVFGTI